MMSSLKELLAKRAALDAEIQETRKRESAKAIESIHAIMAEYGLTKDDVFGEKPKRNTQPSKVAAKYKNPETGETWSGRGIPPKWIKDQDREKFLIS
jgi:DNA-binding protein H-NS